MRKRRNHHRKAAIIACSIMLAATAASGCSKNADDATTGTEISEEDMEISKNLQLSFYTTGCSTFTDTDGKEKTSLRFLIENKGAESEDWFRVLSGHEYLKAGKDKTEVYSRLINDEYRYAEAVLDGVVTPEQVGYEAAGFKSGPWSTAGEEQYTAIKALEEEGALYFYNGTGMSIGKIGERTVCTWLAGFTSDTTDESGNHPEITSVDNFSLSDANGNEIPVVNGASSEPVMEANEFGIEVMINAADAETVITQINRSGMVLHHKDTEGNVTSFTLIEKNEAEAVPETAEAESVEPETSSGEGTEGSSVNALEGISEESTAEGAESEDAAEETAKETTEETTKEAESKKGGAD